MLFLHRAPLLLHRTLPLHSLKNKRQMELKRIHDTDKQLEFDHRFILPPFLQGEQKANQIKKLLQESAPNKSRISQTKCMESNRELPR